MIQVFVDGPKDITDVLDTKTGEKWFIEKESGRRIHPLEFDAPKLAETVAGLQAEIGQIQANDNLSEKYKKEQVAQRQSQILAYLDGKQGEYFTRAQAEFETIQGQYQAQESLNKDAVRTKMGPMLDAANAELAGQHFRNLGEVEAFYQTALKNDSTLAYAMELKGENWLRTIEPHNPHIGSLGKDLERARKARGQDDTTRALLGKLETLRAGANALNSVARQFHRQANGVTTPNLGTWARQIQELEWSINGYLSESTGPVMGDQETGRSGGVYMPTKMPIFTEG